MLEKLKKEVRLEYDRHIRFRHYFNKRQELQSLCSSLFLLVFGICGMSFLGKYFLLESKNIPIEFGHLCLYSLIWLIGIGAGKLIKWKNQARRERYSENVPVVATLLYLFWGFQVMEISIREGRNTNYIPLLITYALLSTLFYFFPVVYLVFYAFCCTGAYIFFTYIRITGTDNTILLNVIIFGTILTGVAMIRYYAERKRCFAEMRLLELTEEYEAQCEELQIALKRVEDLNESQKMFTASMNHELRSPLNGILGLLQILKEDKSLSESQYNYVYNAHSSSQLMLEIVNDLLDYAKMGTNEFTIRNEQFDLRDILNNIRQTADKQADTKGLKFRLKISDDTYCMLVGDEMRIRQIIYNLVSNGIKYTERGVVELSIQYENDLLTIMCSDTGQGIAADSIDALFDPFVRLNEKKNNYIQGTGLGLSIVKSLVDKMNGAIDVKSEVDVGTTFTVKLPLEVYDKSVKYSDVKSYSGVDTESIDFSGIEVLCVDDSKVNLIVFEGLLKKTGIKVDKAYSGFEAIDKANANKYDMIFMDHQMPNMSGVEAFEIIRKESTINKDTPVIILTANVGKDIEEEYAKIGFNGYMSKPVLREQLIETIRGIK